LQGFTAVFALFIVPNIDLSGVDLDDSSENVEHFVASRFGAKSERGSHAMLIMKSAYVL
jgi:hypothetical protein